MEAKNIDNSKKYRLDETDSIDFYGRTLYRIVALKDFSDVKAGDKGGYVESEDNLSQNGNAWVYDDAKVLGRSGVSGNAKVYDKVEIYGFTQLVGNASISGYGELNVDDIITYTTFLTSSQSNNKPVSQEESDSLEVYKERRIMQAESIDPNKKYRRDKSDSIKVNGHDLYRIVALKDFADVKAGDKGGYVESEDNLSHEGDAWVYDDAKVFGKAFIYDNAKASDNAQVSGNSHIFGNSKVFGNAQVSGDSHIFGNSKVFGNAQVSGNSHIFGNSKVFGNARVRDNSHISDNSQVFGRTLVLNNVRIFGNSKVFGNTFVYRNAWVFDNAQVSGNSHIYGKSKVFGNAKVSDNVEVYREARVSGDTEIHGYTKIAGAKITGHGELDFNDTITEDIILTSEQSKNEPVLQEESESLEVHREEVDNVLENIDNGKKYRLDDTDSIDFNGHILYRIVALKDFADVKAGDKGGYVESEDNLSQDGNSWVYHRAKVWNAARISNNAQVFGQAEVFGDAKVSDNAKVGEDAQVSDNAQVGGTSWVYGNAEVSDNAQVGGEAEVYDNAQVSGNAQVYDRAHISGYTQIAGDAKISGDGELNVNDTIMEDVVLDFGRNASASESESLSVEESRRKGLGI